MDTLELIGTVLLYFVLPVLIIFGTMIIIRRKREKDAGRRSHTSDESVKASEMSDVKAEEAKEERHQKADESTEQKQTGNSEDTDKT